MLSGILILGLDDVVVGEMAERSLRKPNDIWPAIWPVERRARRRAPIVGERFSAVANWGRKIPGRNNAVLWAVFERV